MIKKDKIMGVTVLDGMVWFESDTHMYRTVKKIKKMALSALLLENFIKELSR